MSKLEKEKKFFEDLMEGFYKEFDYDKELEQKRIAEVRTAHADGLEEGITRGISQGQYKEKREMVTKMLKEKAPLDFISKISDMSITELESMQKELSYS